jgi:hypothetical protein
MSQTIVNLTLPIVNKKIDDILASYPLYPHQQVFSDSELRQKLTSYVLSRLPVVYVTMENADACTLTSPLGCYSSEQHEQINRLIHQGIDSLMQHRHQFQHQAAGQADATLTPSHWFG